MNRIIIDGDQKKGHISKHIYGHFAEHLGHCIYDGFWVGEDSPIPNIRGIRKDIIEAFQKIRIPNLRWPGGCFADEYHWQDGIGPRAERPTMVNTHWGGVVENNAFGTHEFMDLCELLNTEPYICGNVGSGTVEEMADWVEYLSSGSASTMAEERRKNGRRDPWKIKFWGVGNENWGCGGCMRPEYYADLYRRYQIYCRNFDNNKLFKIACGASGDDYHWTEVLMREAGRHMDGLSLHYYTSAVWGSNKQKCYATQFDEEGWFNFLHRAQHMETLVTRHATIMDRYDPEKRVALVVDEWGAWYEVEKGTNPRFLYQQNTMRDAMIAALTLDIFNKHCDRVRVANLAQAVNVLQAPLLTDGAALILTPTYYVFDLYKEHQDAHLLATTIEAETYSCKGKSMDSLGGTASVNDKGTIHLTVQNRNPHKSLPLTVQMRGGTIPGDPSGRILTGDAMTSHNTVEHPQAVTPREFSSFKQTKEELQLTLPPLSIVALDMGT